MKNSLSVIVLVLFSLVLISCKEKISMYDLCMNPELHRRYNKPSIYDYKYDEEFIQNNWNMAESFFDKKEYQKAIYHYKEVLVSFACKYENFNPYFNISYEDTVKNFEVRYFSLYNIACCYSLLNDFENAKIYLNKAIESGYPYFNHIVKDDDLKNLFKSDENILKEVSIVFNKGNDTNTVIGRQLKFIRGPSAGIHITFVDENTVIYEPFCEGAEKCHDYYYGKYNIKNYNVVISFYKEEYYDMSNSVNYYVDLREGNYTVVSHEIKDFMVLPLSLEENNEIVFSEF